MRPILALAILCAAWLGTAATGLGADSLETLKYQQILSEFAAGRFDVATEHLDEFAKRWPDSDHLPALFLAQAHADSDATHAGRLYQQVAERFPDTPEADEARIGRIELLLAGADPLGALKDAEKFLDTRASSSLAPKARILLGRSAASLGRHAAAADAYAGFLALTPDDPQAPVARLGLADAKFQIGRFNDARVLYEKLIKVSGPDVDPTRAAFGAAQCWERLAQPLKARAIYERIVREAPGSFYAASARDRITEIQRTEQARRESRLPPPQSRERWAVRIAPLSQNDAETVAGRYIQAGFRTSVRPIEGDHLEVLIGDFTTRVQAEFFAEELAKTAGHPLDVVDLTQTGDAGQNEQP